MRACKKSIVQFMLLMLSISVFANSGKTAIQPQTLNELQNSIQIILDKTNTIGAAVVLVSGDSIVYKQCFGKADVEQNIEVDENTLFRLGSVSKLFVGLAALKLQEEGSLNLKDEVKKYIPELKIDNPWEEEYPIRIENLLEHTAGFNDWSLAELGCNDPGINTLEESLAFYPKGRKLKYAPGTRTQYSNLGVSIAAYVVEKVSGMPYEDYVAVHFFEPLGIRNMSYSISEKYTSYGAKGYENGKLMSILYPLYKPSAALVGTPSDLSKLLLFFVDREKAQNTQILSNSSLQRMQRGESFSLAKTNLFNDNLGLTSYATSHNNFVYFGHGGHVPGSNADLRYLPGYNLGFAIMVNNEDESVTEKIASLIMAYQTKDLPQNHVENKTVAIRPTADLSGYYIPCNYKFDALKSLDKIKRLKKFWYKGDTLYSKTILNGNSTIKFVQTNKVEYRAVSNNKFGFVEVNDAAEGNVIYGNIGMLKKISPLYANVLLIIFWALFTAPVIITVFAIISLIIYPFKKNKNKTVLKFALLPLLSILIFTALIVALKMKLNTNMDAFILLGNISSLSVLLFVGTICFALTSVYTFYYIVKNRKTKMSKLYYYYSFFVSIINVMFTIYFFSNGLIGIMTWS